MERIPASDRTREKLRVLMEGRSEVGDGRSELVRLAARLIIEEALEGEARDALGRDYYARGATPGAGYRNGYRPGRVTSAEGAIAYSAPQIADRSEPFRSRIREVVRGRTEELEALAVEMYARGLSTRDIEAVFADTEGRSLLSRTAVSEITERLWAEYEAFATRDLAEFEVTYLFVDGIAERLHLGQPREAVLAAWGILADGKKALLHLAPGTKEDTAGQPVAACAPDCRRRHQSPSFKIRRFVAIFAMLRGPTHSKAGWRFRHGAFVNSEREVIVLFICYLNWTDQGAKAVKGRGSATREPQGRDRRIGRSAGRRLCDERSI
jgi:putative transposase